MRWSRLLSAVLRLVWSAGRLHGGQKLSESHVFEQIRWEVGVKLSQLKNVQQDSVNSIWSITASIF